MEKFKLQSRRYLGCKAKLINFIHDVVDENCENIYSVADIFAGTGIVGYSFADRCSVTVNDTLLSNVCAYHTFFSDQKYNQKKIWDLIDFYNSSNPVTTNYYSDNFGNTYLSTKNMIKVGFIRDDIDLKFELGEINLREKYILITSLIYAIDRIANTVGHYDAFRKNGNLSPVLKLIPPEIKNLPYKNDIFNEDGNMLAKNLCVDLVYIDPPYNSRQYCDAYHFLENVAKNKKNKVYGVARKMDRSALKSSYCTTKATNELENLIRNLNTKYILLSYNNTGDKSNDRSNAKITDDDIIRILQEKGKVKIFEKEFNLFSTGKSSQSNHKERLFLCIVGESQKNSVLSETIDIPSPLNYTGGKFKILHQLKDKFPTGIKNFYDIFCGGANIGANIDSNKIFCIDKNEQLISLLNYLKNIRYEDLILEIESKITYYGLSNTYINGYEYYGCDSGRGVGSFNKLKFAKLRDDYNESKDRPNILFLMLILFSFNNQIRFNRDNKFNLPVGKRDFNASIRRKLKQFMINIKQKDIIFECKDFRELNINLLKGEEAFLYLDPPYFLGDAAYNENGGWTENDEIDLLSFLEECNDYGVRFALSNVIEHKNNQHNLLVEWCIRNEFNIIYINRTYNNSSYHLKDRKAFSREVLITNY